MLDIGETNSKRCFGNTFIVIETDASGLAAVAQAFPVVFTSKGYAVLTVIFSAILPLIVNILFEASYCVINPLGMPITSAATAPPPN